MAQYKVFFKKSVEEDLKNIPKKTLLKILEKIKNLENDPRPVASEKLTGQEKYRLRQGSYRIIYSSQDKELSVYLVKIAHRKEVYKRQL